MTISKAEVEAAQKAWGEAVVHVGAASDWKESHRRAGVLFDTLYVGDGSLLFCPTKAAERQFRPTRRDAVSYFVGRDDAHPEDGGFALEPWAAVHFEGAGVVCRDGVALAMGNYIFERPDGSKLKVEYTFGYVRDDQGALRIQLHHSALPFGG